MHRLLILALLTGCSAPLACRIEKQRTDHPTKPYRAQEICERAGYSGTIERTLCRSAVPLPSSPTVVCP
jgi:hypothetical protein